MGLLEIIQQNSQTMSTPRLFYPLVILSAFLVGIWLSKRYQRSNQLDSKLRTSLLLSAFVGGVLGAKVPFLFDNQLALVPMSMWLMDGKTIVFGLVGGYIGVEIAKWRFGLRTKTGDDLVVPVAVAIGIGRIGCLCAGCCYGAPTSLPWGIDFGDGNLRHPTQVYEMIFHLSFAVILDRWYHQHRFRNHLIQIYLSGYLCYRFLTEWLRPEPIQWLSLTFYQWSCLVFLSTFLLLWRWELHHTQKHSHPMKDLP